MEKLHFSKVVIAGIGLMGGSLGLAIKKFQLADQVVGLARRPLTIRHAKALGCIDTGTISAARAAQDASLVVLAGPISSTPELLKELLPNLPSRCLITDVGSTKTELLRQIERIMPVAHSNENQGEKNCRVFVGSHPMAGSEKAGVKASRPDLYKNALCILVPTPRTPTAALARVAAFWRAVGCDRVPVMTPQEHDRLTAVVSHLPHALAVVLANLAVDLNKRDDRLMEVAATGFRDTTRIAASHPKMWQDIFLSNRQEICLVLENYIEQLTRFKNLLQKGAQPALLKELEKACNFRMQLEKTDNE